MRLQSSAENRQKAVNVTWCLMSVTSAPLEAGTTKRLRDGLDER